ncbi:papilin b, proteoglycan-like sulfated glycoprotein isoform X2 [Mastacembelus armatus]|uniref:Papilin b, proteoglycan-like sulfated glycoprotein n=1 Tax=Mastacembelus armatus TaxID=205130 RepID=A0A3Q3L8U6_9TELE|nr:papilin-like isoform X2 [Mastacembelus armatus]
MSILQALVLLQLLVVPAFALPRLTHDYWGEFGAYGPCSRTCGTGVAMRTRKCITSRTDGGHNCRGSPKSFRTCNTHECPVGAKDFREEQCSQFDRLDFQGKRHTWVPYYGASNPCELYCVLRGENFFYRHRSAVVDGTPCYVGRTNICVNGICRILIHGEFMGLDDDTNSVLSTASVTVAPHPRDTRTYMYKTGVYNECSATCNGGMQYRSVECWEQDPVNPRVVDESYCINQRLQRPLGQQACNVHRCTAEYSVSSYSVCSVTCGEGQQRREVICVGPGGEHLADHACRGLTRPASVRACRRPACFTHITWHVTDYSLCTKSCGGGVRDRIVGCFDTDLNPYPETRCGLASKPATVEACNSQPCPGRQMVPSVQDPLAHENIITGFVPHVPVDPSASRPDTNIAYDPYPPVSGLHCLLSMYGCCPDGRTTATGPSHEGCFQDDCVRTRYGCCLDGVSPAQGFGRAGCPEQQTTISPPPTVVLSVENVCSLPRDEGSCDTWKVRFYYDSGTRKCTEFWYGSCQGNANNFVSLEACERECGGRGTLRARA